MDSHGGSLYPKVRRQPRRCDARYVLKGNRMGIVAVLALALLVGVVVSNAGPQSPQTTTQEQRTQR